MSNYSPLRYPGGKARLYNLIKDIIIQLKIDDCTYIEPFAGGASIGLQLLINGDVNRIVINDKDKAIYSFWKAILEETDRFIQMIEVVPVTIVEWRKQKAIYLQSYKYSFEYGFATFFLNRTNRSGILSAGPIGGYGQEGTYKIDCRFNKETLIQKIKNISTVRNKIVLYNKDIQSFVNNYLPKYDYKAFAYFDPPYFNKGSLLYQNHFKSKDHVALSECIRSGVDCDWVISYDSVDKIKEIYNDFTMKDFYINYSLSNKGKGKEVLIFKNKGCIPENYVFGQQEKPFIITDNKK
ncbi:MAG: DNA adenine methylase [Oscillospiraceae bacterium]